MQEWSLIGAAWADGKGGVIGTYHHMSEAHLSRYTAEFDFRYNSRKVSDAERADAALIGAAGKRLTSGLPLLRRTKVPGGIKLDAPRRLIRVRAEALNDSFWVIVASKGAIMADAIKPGDVVRLKSGGPNMTVSQVGEAAFNGGPKVWCEWFDDKNAAQKGSYNPLSVVLVPEP